MLKKLKISFSIIFFVFFSSQANSFQEFKAEEDLATTYLNYTGVMPLEEKGGAVKWQVFWEMKETKINKTDEATGIEFEYYVPEYTPEIKALDGKKIRLYGFIFPLQETKKQKNFLFGGFPLTCPFHYHVSPKMTVEVLSDKGIEFSFDPVLIEGTFEIKFDKETQIFYYLKDARRVD
jgi:hypothetical protein